MWSLFRPSDKAAQSFLDSQAHAPFSYPEVGASQGDFPHRYQHDFNRVCLGKGEAVFHQACDAIRQWKMFPTKWTQILPIDTPVREGQMVAVLARAMGMWWLNACRIVSVVDELSPVRRFGFSYGTVEHIECGEERFTIEWFSDDTVWYDLRAFSRPMHWTVRLAYPLARRLQQKFARESLASMQAAVA